MDKQTLIELYSSDLNKLLALAKEKTKNTVEFCSLISARTGKCQEGCKYCAQSSYYMTNIPTHPLVETQEVIKVAREAKANGATRFAIVTSGRGPLDKDMPRFCEMISEINKLGFNWASKRRTSANAKRSGTCKVSPQYKHLPLISSLHYSHSHL